LIKSDQDNQLAKKVYWCKYWYFNLKEAPKFIDYVSSNKINKDLG